MRFPRLQVALLAALLGLGTSACGGSSVDRTVASMEDAVVAASAVAVQDVSTLAGSTSTISGVVAATTANVTITTVPATGTVRVLKDRNELFVAGDSAAVAGFLGLSSSAVAAVGGKWIGVTSADAPYGAIAESLTPKGLVEPFLAKTPTQTSLLATASTEGSTVLSGPWHGDGPTNGWSGLTSLRIDPKTSLPKSGLIELHHNSDVATRAAVFSSWTATVSLVTPTVVVPYASMAK